MDRHFPFGFSSVCTLRALAISGSEIFPKSSSLCVSSMFLTPLFPFYYANDRLDLPIESLADIYRCQGLRMGADKSPLAWASSMNRSAVGSHLSLRPNLIEISATMPR